MADRVTLLKNKTYSKWKLPRLNGYMIANYGVEKNTGRIILI